MVSRGEIHHADLGEQVGHEQATSRPVLVVSAQPWLDMNPPVVAVVPLTRKHRDYPTHVEIEPGTSGLKSTSYARCEDIRAISPDRLESRYGYADELAMTRIGRILKRLLAI